MSQSVPAFPLNRAISTALHSPVPFLLGVFTVSGFSGLIYESLWTHYLKLFLGHASYAQSFVISVFMGGMSLGAWLCSRLTGRLRSPLRTYAIIEGAIGVAALLFHGLFTTAVEASYSRVLPALGPGLMTTAYTFGLSIALILPQSVLLGSTFPLMTAGLCRLLPERRGWSVSMAYFSNSLGGAVGVLASGFWLIRAFGLPGTMIVAGTMNLIIAAIVWALAGALPKGEPEIHQVEPTVEPVEKNVLRLMLVVAAATGSASFVYEIAWIRMLTLVLGGSTHAFELMLSAFILGLALGGLWIRRRIDHLGSPLRYLGGVQLAMGALAVATFPLYGKSFALMEWLVSSLDKTDGGNAVFNLASHGVAIAVMLPATFCAGMTLPLITAALFRSGWGERSIGAVYGVNTLGGILGVVLAVQLGLPLLGLKGLLLSGAALDIALGILLVWFSLRRRPWSMRAAALPAAALVVLLAVGMFVRPDPLDMASGVYRGQGRLERGEIELVAQRDGRTSTVQILRKSGRVMFLRNNGKSEAAVTLDPLLPPRIDEATMALIGGLPALMLPEARRVANIGFGSGMTAQALLLGLPRAEVDSIEIEPAVIELARHFSPHNDQAYRAPRSRIHIDDAKAFLSKQAAQYDIIISEPPNPWVSGVAGLFSREFYGLVGSHLAPQGLFLQWIQMYEIDLDIVTSILKALDGVFEDYQIYAANDTDLIVVAAPRGAVPPLRGAMLADPRFAAHLQRIGVHSLDDIALRRVADRRTLQPWLRSSKIPANSDYRPYVDQRAARARFLVKNVSEFLYLDDPYPIVRFLGSPSPIQHLGGVEATHLLSRTGRVRTARLFLDAILKSEPGQVPQLPRTGRFGKVIELAQRLAGGEDAIESYYRVAIDINPFLTPDEAGLLWTALERWPAGRALRGGEIRWLWLFRAAGTGDAEGMAREAGVLLASPQHISAEKKAYLLAMGMLGNIARGDTQTAARLWKTHYAATFGAGRPLLMYQVLAAHAGVGA